VRDPAVGLRIRQKIDRMFRSAHEPKFVKRLAATTCCSIAPFVRNTLSVAPRLWLQTLCVVLTLGINSISGGVAESCVQMHAGRLTFTINLVQLT